jgi:hypothetical protein
MPSLLEMERALRDALVSGEPPPGWLAGSEPSIRERVGIYRNTVLATLVRALRLGFPTVERLVGAEFFEGAAQAFALAHPASSADLNAYGGAFAAFLAEFGPCAGLAYLPDVARLDGAVARALHADDATALDVRALAQLDPARAGELRFRFHPSLSLLRSPFPVDAIWAAVLQQDEAAMAAIDLHADPVHLLVQRVDGRPVVVRLPEPQWHWTAELVQGRAFAELLAEDTASEVAALLARHLVAGRVVAFLGDVFEEASP